MKLRLRIGLIAALMQLVLASWVCWIVEKDESGAVLFGTLYFGVIGYCPWAMIFEGLFPRLSEILFPGINFQLHGSIVRYLPNVIISSLNWFLIGFLIGFLLEKTPSAYRKTKPKT